MRVVFLCEVEEFAFFELVILGIIEIRHFYFAFIELRNLAWGTELGEKSLSSQTLNFLLNDFG